MTRRIALVAVLLLPLAACAPEGQRRVHPDVGLSLVLGPAWGEPDLASMPREGIWTRVVLAAREPNTARTLGLEILHRPEPKSWTLEQIEEGERSSIGASGGQILESGRGRLAGRRAVWVRYASRQYAVPTEHLRYKAIVGDVLWDVDFAMLEGTRELHADEIERVLRAIRVES